MKQSITNKIDQIWTEMVEMIEYAAPAIARVIAFAVFVGVCAVPFLWLPDLQKPTAWYSLGAYGVYLLGAAQLLGRLYIDERCKVGPCLHGPLFSNSQSD